MVADAAFPSSIPIDAGRNTFPLARRVVASTAPPSCIFAVTAGSSPLLLAAWYRAQRFRPCRLLVAGSSAPFLWRSGGRVACPLPFLLAQHRDAISRAFSLMDKFPGGNAGGSIPMAGHHVPEAAADEGVDAPRTPTVGDSRVTGPQCKDAAQVLGSRESATETARGAPNSGTVKATDTPVAAKRAASSPRARGKERVVLRAVGGKLVYARAASKDTAGATATATEARSGLLRQHEEVPVGSSADVDSENTDEIQPQRKSVMTKRFTRRALGSRVGAAASASRKTEGATAQMKNAAMLVHHASNKETEAEAVTRGKSL